MILLWIDQEIMRKSFEAACLSAPSVCLAYGKFVSLYICLFSMKLKIIGKFCFFFFRANVHFWLFCVFLHCLECHSY